MNRWPVLALLLPVFGAGAGAQTPTPAAKDPRVAQAIATDPVFAALLLELDRARTLTGLTDPVYYLDLAVDDSQNFVTGATLGAAFAPSRVRFRPVRLQVRVGSHKFDNTNSIYSDLYSGTRFDAESLPVDGPLLSLRHTLWLGFDRAYKTAAEAIARKRAALRAVSVSHPLPDFSPAPPLILLEPPATVKLDEEALIGRIRSLSALFLAYPEITASTVDLEVAQGTFYFANSEGAAIRIPDRLASVRVRAVTQAPDGMPLHDGDAAEVLDPASFPAEAQLRRMVEDVAGNLRALGRAPAGANYVGPVLFEPQAAAQIFAEIFAEHLAIQPRPVSEPGRPLPLMVRDFEGRIGARVLPEFLDAADDPLQTSWEGAPLAGHYRVDLEGVAARPVSLVENGILKAVLATRQPVRDAVASNGHARLPGMFGQKIPRIGNLFVSASRSQPLEALKKELAAAAARQNKSYGLLVRKMDYPSTGSLGDLRALSQRAMRSGGGGRPVSAPVLIYRVYPDGREELVRGLRFRNFSARSFRDVAAASSERALLNYIDNGAPLALMGAGSFVVGCSVVAPGVLFEELELEALDEQPPKLPIVPPPALGGG
jgi:hypothetical protein